MRVLAAWLAVAASEPAEPTGPVAHAPVPVLQGQPLKAVPAAGTEVGELIVIAPRKAEEPDWSKRLNLDVRGEFAGPDVPYLRRRPTNGCKFMAGGAKSPSGHDGAAGGLVCAKAF